MAVLFVHTCRWSQYGRNTTLVSNVNLKFVVGSVIFTHAVGKVPGIRLLFLNKQYLQKGKIVDAIKYCSNTHSELQYLQTKEEENE